MTTEPPPPPPSVLAGVRYGRVRRAVDSRGAFRELWRAATFEDLDPADAGLPPDGTVRFVQANLSTSETGVLRGLHLHRRQLDHWVVSMGRAFVALVDARPMLADPSAEPIIETRVLGPDDWVTIPVGVAHGFLALEALDLVYFVTNAYDGTDELGFAWDDHDVAVPWPRVDTPDGLPILSDRDRANPSLVDLVGRLRTEA
ncbi:MAG TPA: dTDP-4-dehydrorhamnose 3,5-epimerase family protein [Candidatus Saccharimonadales bacterium]|nr:dTDP-4-dehydrorhamnose 3,5-epimerase family protein [Candidatus Saccharimonadales bacterium]